MHQEVVTEELYRLTVAVTLGRLGTEEQPAMIPAVPARIVSRT